MQSIFIHISFILIEHIEAHSQGDVDVELLIAHLFTEQELLDLADSITDGVVMTLEGRCRSEDVPFIERQLPDRFEELRLFSDWINQGSHEILHGLCIGQWHQELISADFIVAAKGFLFRLGSDMGVIAFSDALIQFFIGVVNAAAADIESFFGRREKLH